MKVCNKTPKLRTLQYYIYSTHTTLRSFLGDYVCVSSKTTAHCTSRSSLWIQTWYWRKIVYILLCRMTFLMPSGDTWEQSWNVPESSKLTLSEESLFPIYVSKKVLLWPRQVAQKSLSSFTIFLWPWWMSHLPLPGGLQIKESQAGSLAGWLWEVQLGFPGCPSHPPVSQPPWSHCLGCKTSPCVSEDRTARTLCLSWWWQNCQEHGSGKWPWAACCPTAFLVKEETQGWW